MSTESGMATSETLGRYELLGLLGSGSFAVAYRARDPLLGREVALKALLTHLAAVPEDRQRFLAEARALAALRHPNIVAVYDVGEQDGRPFFTMELVDGRTLAETIALSGPLPLTQAVAIVTALASALDCVHAAGLVHRDVKDANVMLSAAGRVVLMDFGIALSAVGPRLTEAGLGLGTVESAAPEQVRGEGIGPAVDIYALGVLTYQMLAGRFPFSGDSAHVLYAHAHLPPPSLRELRPGLPDALDAAVSGALAKDPRSRPASAGAFAASFVAAASEAPPEPATTIPTVAPATMAPACYLEASGTAGPLSVWLRAGFTTFHCRHDAPGGGLFRVRLLDGEGLRLKLLVEALHPYNGTTAFTVPAVGDYALAIEARGPWTCAIEQPDVAAQIPVREATGAGDAVVYLALAAGVRSLKISHRVWNGTLFQVTLLDSRGEHPERLVTTTGPYRGVVTRRVEQDGLYILTIEAEGSWNVGVV